MGKQLGLPGQFGRAVLATHKKTGEKTAIKVTSHLHLRRALCVRVCQSGDAHPASVMRFDYGPVYCSPLFRKKNVTHTFVYLRAHPTLDLQQVAIHEQY